MSSKYFTINMKKKEKKVTWDSRSEINTFQKNEKVTWDSGSETR
jgi:hypothetical protein